MKLRCLLIEIVAIELFSCQSKQQTENEKQSSAEQVFELIERLPDTMLISKSMNENEFQADLSDVHINVQLTALLDGEWTNQNGKIKFLNTLLETGDKVVFYDTIGSSMTGWGTIKYNRSAKFYFTESGSHIYEVYVLGCNNMVLTQYEYRNDDLTMKERPKAIRQELKIDFINDDQIKLSLGGQTVELKRKNMVRRTLSGK